MKEEIKQRKLLPSHGFSVKNLRLSLEILNKKTRLIAWKEDATNAYVFNFDGRSRSQTNPGMAAFGGLIRNSNGDYQCGFHGNIGYSISLHAEIMALIQGI